MMYADTRQCPGAEQADPADEQPDVADCGKRQQPFHVSLEEAHPRAEERRDGARADENRPYGERAPA